MKYLHSSLIVLLLFFSCESGDSGSYSTQSDYVKLYGEAIAPGDAFGYSVALSGDTLVVGATQDDDQGTDSGAVYVFAYNSYINGWSQVEKLTVGDGVAGDKFGRKVAISGDSIIVGVPACGDNGLSSGAAYIFSPYFADKLLPGDGDRMDMFGCSVAISGETAIIGSLGGDDDMGENSGAAYIFEYNEDNWPHSWYQRAKLVPQDGAAGDSFGWSVGVSGNTTVIGSIQNDDKGSAYVFTYNSDSAAWEESQKLTVDDGGEFDLFGYSVAISGDTLLVSAPGEDVQGKDSGAAYVFTCNSDTSSWEQTQKLISPGETEDGHNFGYSLSIDGATAVVGSKGETVYVYANHSGTWSLDAVYTPGDAALDSQFGCEVAVYGDRIVTGDIINDDKSEDAGAVYLYSK